MDSSSRKAKQSFFFSFKFKVFTPPPPPPPPPPRFGRIVPQQGVKQSYKEKGIPLHKKVVEHETVASRVAMLHRIGLPLNTATP